MAIYSIKCQFDAKILNVVVKNRNLENING
mgnify:CR=1 FL=1